MRNRMVDGRDEVTVCVTVQDAQAIERCLKAERGVIAHSSQRVRVIHFDRGAPRNVTMNTLKAQEHSLDVRVVERSAAPDKVTLEVNRVLSDETRYAKVELPRRALRAAMRRNALKEIIPEAPADLVPVLGVECTRRSFKGETGWTLTLDRDIAFHRVDPRMLERTGQLALGVPDRFADGRVLVTVRLNNATLPAWLDGVLRASSEWNVVEEGYTLVAPRPTAKRSNAELRLVLH